MMRSLPLWLRRTLLMLLSIIVLSCLTLFWLLGTESGTHKLIRFALSQTSFPVDIVKIEGTFGNGLKLSGIAYTSDELILEVATTEVDIHLADLLGRRVVVDRLHIDNVLAVKPVAVAPDAATDKSFELPDSVELPVNILLRDFQLSRVSYGESRELAEQVITRVGLTATWIDQQLNVSDIDADTAFGQITGSANMETTQPYPLGLQLDSSLQMKPYPELVSATTLSGSLKDLQIDHRSSAPYSLSLSGAVSDALQDPWLDIELKARNTRLEEIVGESLAVVVTSDITLKGSVSELGITGTATTALPEVGNTSASFEGVVKTSELMLSDLTILLPEVGDGAELGVSGSAGWSGVPALDLSVFWNRLPWPLQGDTLAAAVNGKATLKGSLENYRVELNSGLESPLQNDGSIVLTAKGTPEKIDIQNMVVQALEGEISGSGSLRFVDGLAISAQLEGRKVNPRTFLQEWPGEIDFKTTATAQITESSTMVVLPELTATGELRGYPLDAKINGELRDSDFTLRKLNVTSGTSRLTASGKVSDQIALTWDIQSEDLASLWPELSGQLNANGRLTGSKDRPIVDASIDGSALEFQDIQVEKLTAAVKLGQSETYEGTALINASNIKAGSYTSESLRLEVAGLRSDHTLDISLKDTLGESRLEASGSLTDENEYSLELARVAIKTADLGTWSLTDPVTVQVKGARTELPNTCMVQDSSKLCFAVLSENQDLSADVEVVDVPLSLFAYVLPPTVKASGRINGGGNIAVSVNSSSYGELQFDLSGLTLESRIRTDKRDSSLSFAPSTLTANVSESGTLTANANFPLLSGGGISFNANLAEEDQPLLDRTLRGELSIEVPSIAFVSDFVPQLSHTTGGLDGLISLTGSVRNPQILGSLGLQDGQFTLVDPGVQATGVSVKLTGNRDRIIAIEGAATSGGGTIKLDGRLALSEDGNSGEFKLDGSEFQVLNTSDAQVWATPNVQLNYSDEEGLKLTGSVTVPRAKVEIDELPKGTVKVSKDQIIVGQEKKKEASALPVEARLDLKLGDDVFLSAFGLDTFLEGSLTLIENSGRPTSANGKIQLRDGKYEAYGQSLTVTTGNLVYAGGSIDEPGVDFRAVRQPVPEVEVGISARGTLNQPSFSVFSTPAMSDSDQLAYLIFGRPMNAEAASENTLITRLALSLGMKGGESISQKLAGELGVDQLGIESQGEGDLSQASLVIGKYISPKLFISYGIGLLEPISTLKLQYALSSKWQLITESSSTKNSADAQYMFER